MNRLEKMINELCPNGVEYKLLNEIAKCQKGKQLNKELLLEEGYPVINGGINPSGYWSEYNCNENRITISQGGASAGFVNYMEEKFWAGAHCFVIVDEKPIIKYKYLYYVIKMYENKLTECQYGAGIPALATSTINELEIPLPPLPIQEEIVRILDNFTKLTTELTTELTAELQERKMQYEYYRDNLLYFDNSIEHILLGDACYIKARIGWQRLTKDEYLTKGDYYLVTGVDIDGSEVNYKKCWYVAKERYEMDENIQLKNGDIIITKDGTIGKVAMINNLDKPAVLNSHLFVIRDLSGKINNRYLMYVLKSKLFIDFIEKNKTQGTIPGLNQATMIRFPIPVPSKDEQELIVSILDKFDKYCNDISEELPAEIELRQKQYEYYRDKLLSFKRIS